VPDDITLTFSDALKRARGSYQAGHFDEAEALCKAILRAEANHFDALHLLAIVRSRLGRLQEALAGYDQALAIKPDNVPALYNRGVTLQGLKRFEDAVASYDQALAIRPDYAEALNNRGNALRDLKRFDDALASYDRALVIKQDFIEAVYNRGVTLQDLKHFDDALVSYDNALSIKPGYANALNNRAVTLQDLKRFEDALANYDLALAIRPDYAEALNNRGNALRDLKRFEDALASYDQALAIRPDHAEVLNNRGNALQGLNCFEDALASYDQALAIKPDNAETLNNRGNALQGLKCFEDALASYDRALAIKPDFAEALYNRGVTLQGLKRFEDALASYDKALVIKPGYADVLNNRGVTLQDLKRFEEALASFDQALVIKADHLYAFGGLADSALKICDWARTAKLDGEIRVHVTELKSIIAPFTLLGYYGDASLQLKCARSYIRDKVPVLPQPLWDGTIYQHDRVRIAYLSADFRGHAVASLIAELFELHDRGRFEVLGVSFGEDDKSEIRSRLIKSFDQFHDVRLKSDRDVAKLLNELQVDIAVDLMGYTRYARPDILAHRPAPIQINYLGYPGTMGAGFIDYVIADKIVLPSGQQCFYTEKIVQLPECYQVNDSRRMIADRIPTRREIGLPDQGFVFCCFNNSCKITAPMFDVWMRLLQTVKGSVLWLLGDNASAETNLRKEAAGRGVDPARLIFAGRLPLEDHLARHRLADIFLDTLPYNAHTTASDALWAGLPLLTCCGESFAGRVAASLLNAVGLPELVTESLEEYEALALKLATNGSRLRSIRQKLDQNRLSYPLFDTGSFRRHIEAAYLTMREIWQRGESPRSFRVELLC
jgi:predicted O-linked N-acetylglucosamine transferase (SPINDLY family)